MYIGDVFNASKFNDGFWTEEKYKGTYIDSHYYHVFDERPRHLDPKEHIALVWYVLIPCITSKLSFHLLCSDSSYWNSQKNHRDTVACCYEDGLNKTIPSKGISRIIGEWSASFDTLVCDKLDIVMAGIALNGEFQQGSMKQYLKYEPF